MLIRNIMSSDVVTVDPDTSIADAANLLKEHKVRRLCVMKGDKLVGIVADSDIKEASPSDATTLSIHEMAYLLSRLKVKEIMTKDPVTIQADKTLDDAALLMQKKKVASLPVMDNKHLVGMITESDIFKALILLTGAHQGGVKFGFELQDRPGSIKEAADVIRSFGGRIISVLTSYEDARDGFRHVFIRAQDIPRRSIKDLKDQLGNKFRILYIQEAEKD